METRLNEFKDKNPSFDTKDRDEELVALISLQEWFYGVWEDGYIQQKRNFDLELINLKLLHQIDGLQKENELIKKQLNF